MYAAQVFGQYQSCQSSESDSAFGFQSIASDGEVEETDWQDLDCRKNGPTQGTDVTSQEPKDECRQPFADPSELKSDDKSCSDLQGSQQKTCLRENSFK